MSSSELTFSMKIKILLFANAFTYCESYIESTCNEANKSDCVKREKCGSDETENDNHLCFTLWELDVETGVPIVKMKGCFTENKACYEKSKCAEKSKDDNNQLYFCCCSGDMCNQSDTNRMYMLPSEAIPDQQSELIFEGFDSGTVLAMLSTFIFLTIVSLTLVTRYCRQRKLKSKRCEVRSNDEDYSPKEKMDESWNQNTVYVNVVKQKQFGDTVDHKLTLGYL